MEDSKIDLIILYIMMPGMDEYTFSKLLRACHNDIPILMLSSKQLPQKEFYLLYKLLSYPNQIFTRIQLMEYIWGPSSDSTDATVCVHINRLRNRFEDCPDFSIVTIRGLGYKAQVKEDTL